MHAAKKEDGVVIVEFALVLPLLMLLIVGTIWFGFALNYWIDETHLTREAARYAAVDFVPCPDSLQECIQQQADTAALRKGGVSTVTDPAVVCIHFPPNAANGSIGQVGDPVQASMTSTLNFIPFLRDGVPGFFDGLGFADITIRATATMRLEAVPADYGEGCF